MGNLTNIQIKSLLLYVSNDACWTQPKHPVGFPPWKPPSLKICNDLIELPATFTQKNETAKIQKNPCVLLNDNHE